jgi:pimeloyl-ACP methyl ester carboxylesterase
MIAVHGWNGDCASTFGSDNRSVFKVIDEPFYDMDCFQYDSKTTSLDDNARLLRERLKALHEKGYRQAILVTHSTGGVIALRMLANISVQDGKIATAEGTWPLQAAGDKGLRIKAIHAWATPINGLRTLVSLAGHLVFSPETLPDLKAGSAYLKHLQADSRCSALS